jgi:hypothetical protein
VITLDSNDVILLGDIANLWVYFDRVFTAHPSALIAAAPGEWAPVAPSAESMYSVLCPYNA